MKFEEQSVTQTCDSFESMFPSLKGKAELKYDEEDSYKHVFNISIIKKHCIDKQKVKEAIDKVAKQSTIVDWTVLLEKELGLEE